MSQQINLVNPLFLKKRYVLGLREMALALGVILVSMLVWGGYVHYQASGLETRAAEQEALQAEAQQELDRLSAAASRPVSALLTERVKTAQVQVAQREVLLASIGDAIDTTSTGFAPGFRALAHGSMEGLWLNAFTLSPGYVSLKGSALNAGLLTAYIDRLGKQPPFSGMQFSGMNAVQASQAVDAKSNTATQSANIDFTLYSGSQNKLAEQGSSNGQR